MDYGNANGNQLPSKLHQYYEKKILERSIEELTLEQFNTAKTTIKHSGDSFRFSRYVKLPSFEGSTLVEGVTPDATDFTKVDIEGTVSQYGQYLEFSDLLLVRHEDGQRLIGEMAGILAESAGESAEKLAFSVITNGNNVTYADGSADRAGVASGASVITASDLIKIRTILRGAVAKPIKSVIVGSTKVGTKPVREAYILYIHPDQLSDFEKLDGWLPTAEYGTQTLLRGEIGSIGYFRVIESLYVPTIEEAGMSIYQNVAFGAEAFSTVDVRGGQGGHASPEFKFNNVGSSGSADPLAQRGTSGVKLDTSAVIMDEAHLIRIESCSSIETVTTVG